MTVLWANKVKHTRGLFFSITPFLPVRRSKRRPCYGNVAGWLSRLSQPVGPIVSKRLNLS